MTLFAGQVLRVVRATGEVSTTYLTVEDSNATGASADPGTVWGTCGNTLASPPVLDMRQLTGTLLDGSAFSVKAVHFLSFGRDFYLMPTERAPEAIATITGSTALGAVKPFSYLDRTMSADDEALQSGQALTVRFDSLGHAVGKGIGQVVVSDDDSLIQFAAETGRGAEVLLGPGHGAHAFNLNTSGQMSLVEVNYHAASGDGSFEALRYTLPQATGSLVYYIPMTGSVVLSQVQSYLGETTLAASAEGMPYADFGLGARLITHRGTATANFMAGSILNDQLLGGDGNDSLVGGMGADKLVGGAGNDVAQGGMQNDTLLGGDGNDLLQGGNDADSLQGDAGNDRLLGNWGNDTLYGGLGNDTINAGSDNDLVFGDAGADILNGFDGNDTLQDGAGQDVFIGGLGVDLFILDLDGAKDRIADFQDGIDHISVGVAFGDLSITTLKSGRVEIAYGNELLWVEDDARHLTAANFTAADFL